MNSLEKNDEKIRFIQTIHQNELNFYIIELKT